METISVEIDGHNFIVPINYSDAYEHHRVCGLFGHYWEQAVSEILCSMLGNKSFGNVNFADIGACCGIYSIIAAKRTSGKVYAFEPQKTNFDLLLKNTSGFDNIFCENFALSSRNGKQKVIDTTGSGDSGASSIISDSDIKLFDDATLVDMDCRKLDSMVISIDIAKIDVEGHAGHVIAGGRDTFSKAKVIFVELHEVIEAGKIATGELNAVNMLGTLGFHVSLHFLTYIHERRKVWLPKGVIAVKSDGLPNELSKFFSKMPFWNTLQLS